MAKNTLSGRLHLLITERTDEYRRFKSLETMTSIPSDTWKSWYHGRQRPTADMIEAICRCWPENAFWLTTGLSDVTHGHNPPEKLKTLRSRTAAHDLWKAMLQEKSWLHENSWTSEEDNQFHVEQDHASGERKNALLDPAIAKKISHWHALLSQISELERIRETQEHSLSEFEIHEHNKNFPF